MKIDFTKDFKFIAKTGEGEWYFVGGQEVKILADCTDWLPTTRLKDAWGLFAGKTMIPYKGYQGELPRDDEDSASFEEFDIYYNGELIDENKTYSDIIPIIRDSKIKNLIDDN